MSVEVSQQATVVEAVIERELAQGGSGASVSPAEVQATVVEAGPGSIVTDREARTVEVLVNQQVTVVEPGRVDLVQTLGFRAVNAGVVTIRTGQPVRLVSGGVELAQANALGRAAVGVAGEVIPVGVSGRILCLGVLEQDDWSLATGGEATLMPATEYWLAPSAAGVLTPYSPSANPDVSQLLGEAMSSTKLFVRVEPAIGL